MQYYIGIDFHLQHSSVALMDQKGRIMDERKLYHTDTKEFLNYFSSLPKNTSIAIEATRNWYWLVDCLQKLGHNVKLVHAKKARIIAESTIKTDKIDARALAQLDRCNFLPQAYIADNQTRCTRELLRYYMSLVRIRTQIKNKVHAVLAKNNIHYSFTDLFGKQGTKFLKEIELPQIFRLELNGYLKLLENLNNRIAETKIEIKNKCTEDHNVKHLITIPGISYFSGLLLASEIGNINRFDTPKKLCSYAGLCSSTHQSADKTFHGHIIKDSNKYIRYALTEAVPYAIKKDPKIYSFYIKTKKAKGANKARIAVARKILLAIYSMLKNNRDYCINNNRETKNIFNRVNSKICLGH